MQVRSGKILSHAGSEPVTWMHEWLKTLSIAASSNLTSDFLMKILWLLKGNAWERSMPWCGNAPLRLSFIGRHYEPYSRIQEHEQMTYVIASSEGLVAAGMRRLHSLICLHFIVSVLHHSVRLHSTKCSVCIITDLHSSLNQINVSPSKQST